MIWTLYSFANNVACGLAQRRILEVYSEYEKQRKIKSEYLAIHQKYMDECLEPVWNESEMSFDINYLIEELDTDSHFVGNDLYLKTE